MSGELDSEIRALEPALRDELTAHWLRRERHELRVGMALSQLGQRMASWAERAVLEGLERAALEEQSHGASCHELAEAYAGRTLPAPGALSAPLADFGTDEERLELSLNLVGLCCVNETIATAWLQHCLDLTSVRVLAERARSHLSDEVGHARIGWAHAASAALTEPERQLIAELIPKLVAVNMAEWLKPDNFLFGDALPSHGHPSAVSSRAVIERAVQELVLPGFRWVGLLE